MNLTHPGICHFEFSQHVLWHVVFSHRIDHEILVPGWSIGRPILMALFLKRKWRKYLTLRISLTLLAHICFEAMFFLCRPEHSTRIRSAWSPLRRHTFNIQTAYNRNISIILKTHPSKFTNSDERYNDRRVVFPEHPPEVLRRFRHRTLCHDVGSSVTITLQRQPSRHLYSNFSTLSLLLMHIWFLYMSIFPEQFTVKAHPALFEGVSQKMRHCYSSLQLIYTFKMHTKHYSSLQLTYTFKTQKTAKARTLYVYSTVYNNMLVAKGLNKLLSFIDLE